MIISKISLKENKMLNAFNEAGGTCFNVVLTSELNGTKYEGIVK